MPLHPAIQAEFERDLKWKHAWPRCLFALIATIEVVVGAALFLTELLNVLTEFWHTNIFGGMWASVLVLINWFLLYSASCCSATICAATCAFIWNLITLIGLGVLIGFDISFILNPNACILTSNCASQPQIISIHSLLQIIPFFNGYSSADMKKFFLQIQAGCAGACFIFSLIYIFTYIGCRMRVRDRTVRDSPVVQPTAPPPPPLPPYSPSKDPAMTWSIQTPRNRH